MGGKGHITLSISIGKLRKRYFEGFAVLRVFQNSSETAVFDVKDDYWAKGVFRGVAVQVSP